MSRTTAPASGRGLPKDPSEVARDMLFELDDVLGRLHRAIKTMDLLTENSPVNSGMDALFDRHSELTELFNDSWAVIVGPASEVRHA